jgi:hypothetical protein
MRIFSKDKMAVLTMKVLYIIGKENLVVENLL